MIRIAKWTAVLAGLVLALALSSWWSAERKIDGSLKLNENLLEARLRLLAPRPLVARGVRPGSYRLHENLGRLEVQRLHLSVPVIEGADDAGLKLGAAHVLGTGYPGTETNCAVAAHRDTLFRSLKDIRKGDVITFINRQSSFRYEVTGMEIVNPTDTAVLASKGSPEMTLVTCYPFYFVGHAPKRYIVHATLSKS